MTLNGVIAITRPKNVVFSNILFIAIFAEVTKNECVTDNRVSKLWR